MSDTTSRTYQALVYLRDYYNMYEMARNGYGTWFSVFDASENVGAEVTQDENGTYVTFTWSVGCGIFKYTTLNASLLGKASDLAVDRCKKMYSSIEILQAIEGIQL